MFENLRFPGYQFQEFPKHVPAKNAQGYVIANDADEEQKALEAYRDAGGDDAQGDGSEHSDAVQNNYMIPSATSQPDQQYNGSMAEPQPDPAEIGDNSGGTLSTARAEAEGGTDEQEAAWEDADTHAGPTEETPSSRRGQYRRLNQRP